MLVCAQANGDWELEKRAPKKSGRARRVSVYKEIRATNMEIPVKDAAPADGLSRLQVRRGRL